MLELISMSRKEEYRLNILRKVERKELTQTKAAEILELSDRQVRNLLRNLKEFGVEGIVSKKRRRMRNRQLPASLKSEALRLIEERYADFSPTFAKEKLEERHHVQVSRETLRKWMIEAHLWFPKRKKQQLHPLRRRKEHFGEMLQGDGSHHDWFENGLPCALLYFIDDATGKITCGKFAEREALDGYFYILEQHLVEYGVPVSLYTDRFSVFETSSKKENLTQFRRALNVLGIKWIGANTPQAKGRIERANRTLQNRLTKEMRLRGIKTIEEGNRFLPEFIDGYNKKFSKQPMKELDLHRPLDGRLDLSRTLSRYEERTLTKDGTFQFHNTHYKIMEEVDGVRKGAKVEVRRDGLGRMRTFIGSKEVVAMDVYESTENSKKIIPIWPDKKKFAPKLTHPWKRMSYNACLKRKREIGKHMV